MKKITDFLQVIFWPSIENEKDAHKVVLRSSLALGLIFTFIVGTEIWGYAETGGLYFFDYLLLKNVSDKTEIYSTAFKYLIVITFVLNFIALTRRISSLNNVCIIVGAFIYPFALLTFFVMAMLPHEDPSLAVVLALVFSSLVMFIVAQSIHAFDKLKNKKSDNLLRIIFWPRIESESDVKAVIKRSMITLVIILIFMLSIETAEYLSQGHSNTLDYLSLRYLDSKIHIFITISHYIVLVIYTLFLVSLLKKIYWANLISLILILVIILFNISFTLLSNQFDSLIILFCALAAVATLYALLAHSVRALAWQNNNSIL